MSRKSTELPNHGDEQRVNSEKQTLSPADICQEDCKKDYIRKLSGQAAMGRAINIALPKKATVHAEHQLFLRSLVASFTHPLISLYHVGRYPSAEGQEGQEGEKEQKDIQGSGR